MRQIGKYILLILCMSLACCDRIETPLESDAMQVRLFANVDVHLDVEQTRSGAASESINIGIVRIDEKVNSGYPFFKECDLLTANLDTPAEGDLRLVSGFKKGSADAPQFFRNSTDEIKYTAWFSKSDYDFASDENSTKVTFQIPAAGDSDILYSNPVTGKMSTGFEVMQFNHALPLFRIYVYKSNENTWGNLKSISVNGLPDKCVLNLPSNGQNNTCSIAYEYSNASGLTLNSELPENKQVIPVGFENKVCVQEWMAAPEVLNNDSNNLKVLNLSVKTNNGADINSEVAVAGNFTAGHAYDIILRFSDDGVVNADVQVEEWVDFEIPIGAETHDGHVFYDLSRNETANCYIISSANFSYSFDATIKGNGSIGAFPGTRIDPTLAPNFVDIIWCDTAVENVFSLETNKIVEGKVLFTVKGHQDNNVKTLQSEGNVLLGVYDKEGEGRQCLWTWHIWITDKPQKQNYTKGYIVLDRNLGAIAPAPEDGSDIGMKGLFYQWGRPTPFRVIQNEQGVKVIDGEKSDTRVTPDHAVANPRTYYGTTETGGDASATNFHDWVDRTQFINPKFVNNLWGYREEEHQQPIKTIYDPCPPGYHVPYSRTWANMEKYWKVAEEFDSKTNEEKVTYWRSLQGINLSIEGNDIWYPFQGYINKDGEYKEGHIHMTETEAYHEDIPIVEVWSSLINRNSLDNLTDDEPYRFLFTRDHGSMLSDSHTNRSRGLAVRCVSDNTTDVVKNLSASQTANCYMVHEDGYYKFDATVRGNGVGSLLPLGGTTTAEINGGLSTKISPYKVDILWWQGDFTKPEDFGNVTGNSAPQNMCLKLLDNGIIGLDGYVAFQITNFSKGNVILAAYDEYDNILWTWHIWLTDKPVDKLSGNYTKMDRFLGATFAPAIGNITALGEQPETSEQITFSDGQLQATFGFYYQWGRKDPIIGPPDPEHENDDSATNSSTAVASAGWWKKSLDGTWTYMTTIPVKPSASIPDVVKDPTAFYRSTTTKDATTSQWFPASFADGYTNVALWGYAVKDYGIQGQTFSKTMHDPCPPGYRTPFHFSWRYDGNYKYAEGDGGEVVTYLVHEPWFEVWQDGVDPNGIVTNKPHFERMWYPFTGYRSPLTGGYEDVGITGYMYTGMPMGQYNTRSFWYGQSQSGQYADSKGHGSAYGKMIRCMKE